MSETVDTPEKVVEKAAAKPMAIRPWKVIVHNDDFTPIEFVIRVLMDHFGMNRGKATVLTLKIHENGSQVVGVYTREIAETKVAIVTKEAQSEGHPLRLTASSE